MMLAAARVMFLSLVRDRAALMLAFVLPPVIFAIFAAIFASATGDGLRLHVGVADLVKTASTRRLVDALQAEPGLRVGYDAAADAEAVRERVRRGAVDVGLVLRADLAARPGEGAVPVLVIEDSSRALAGPIVLGQLQKTLNERLPDVALARILADVERAGKLAAEERAFLEEAFRAQARTSTGFAFAALVEREAAVQTGRAAGPVAYYAGAVAAVFLLFSALQGATSLIDERQSGIYERLLSGPGGMVVVVVGKFLFLAAQGMLQVALIFAAAALFYGVDLLGAFMPWLATAALASAAAAGFGLAVSAACTSRQQAETGATFGVLLLSAIGGSMVPRFMMPAWLQDVGWLSPNAWMISAFQAALTPGAEAAWYLGSWGVLAGMAGLSLLAAVAFSRRPGAV